MPFAMAAAGAGGRPTYRHVISGDVSNWIRTVNMPNVITTTKVHLIIEIQSGGRALSNTTDPAMTINGLFPGSVVDIINAGSILGRGGNGGGAGGQNTGTVGSTALLLAFTGVCNITNGSGNIWGGGGGGGRGGIAALWDAETSTYEDFDTGVGQGGGGGACNLGVGGLAINGGTNGSNAGSGAGCSPGGGGAGANNGGSGGAGATFGEVGSTGGGGKRIGGPSNGTTISNGFAGGQPGAAIHYGSATLNFISGNGAPNIKGAVTV